MSDEEFWHKVYVEPQLEVADYYWEYYENDIYGYDEQWSIKMPCIKCGGPVEIGVAFCEDCISEMEPDFEDTLEDAS